MPILYNLFQKIEAEEILLTHSMRPLRPSFSWYQHQTKDMETKQQTNISHEHRCKYPLKGISKSDVTMYRKNIYHDQVELFQDLIN